MNALTQPRSDAVGPRPTLAEARVKESTLRRVGQVAAAVVLIAAGIFVGVHASPELGATLVAAGVHAGVDAFTRGHDDKRHRSSGLALELA